MAYILTIVFIGLVQNGEKSLWSVLPMFFMQLLLETDWDISSGLKTSS